MSYHHSTWEDISHFEWAFQEKFHKGSQIIYTDLRAKVMEEFRSDHIELPNENAEEVTVFILAAQVAEHLQIRWNRICRRG
jgi:hypothetical protein